jgi:hypothetical protein
MAGKCDLPLHGMTVVIDTPGPRLYIGRYDFEDEEHVVLNHAEIRDLTPGESKEQILARSARYGVFVNAQRIRVPRAEIASIRRLSEIPPEA